jgi:hypothetical protein
MRRSFVLELHGEWSEFAAGDSHSPSPDPFVANGCSVMPRLSAPNRKDADTNASHIVTCLKPGFRALLQLDGQTSPSQTVPRTVRNRSGTQKALGSELNE